MPTKKEKRRRRRERRQAKRIRRLSGQGGVLVGSFCEGASLYDRLLPEGLPITNPDGSYTVWGLPVVDTTPWPTKTRKGA